MFVHHLLLAVAVDDNRIIIEAPDDTPQLETVDQINGDGDRLLADLVQKSVLDINCLFQWPYLLCTFTFSLIYSL